MKYKDYYKVLGVARDASQKDITKAFRRLARQHHPDVSKEKDEGARFKEVNEAYEVLRDPEKRKLYDSLGSDWRSGQSFTPPPGFDGVRFDFGGAQGGGGGAFSDFFEALFGGLGGMGGMGGGGRGPEATRGGRRRRGPFPGGGDPFAGFGGGFPGGFEGMGGGRAPQRGDDHEVEIEVSLEDVYHGAVRKLSLQGPEGTRTFDVRIPAGIVDGGKIRLSGQGGSSAGGGEAGHLYLKVKLVPHPVFKVDRHDLSVEVAVAPWEAALGGRVEVPTLDGPVVLTLPAGSSSGRRMRLRGKGLPARDGARGDLYAVVKIVVPETLTAEERELFERLAAASAFRPRT